jgi:hypothetical protein
VISPVEAECLPAPRCRPWQFDSKKRIARSNVPRLAEQSLSVRSHMGSMLRQALAGTFVVAATVSSTALAQGQPRAATIVRRRTREQSCPQTRLWNSPGKKGSVEMDGRATDRQLQCAERQAWNQASAKHLRPIPTG